MVETTWSFSATDSLGQQSSENVRSRLLLKNIRDPMTRYLQAKVMLPSTSLNGCTVEDSSVRALWRRQIQNVLAKGSPVRVLRREALALGSLCVTCVLGVLLLFSMVFSDLGSSTLY